jgi:hypothetical protein
VTTAEAFPLSWPLGWPRNKGARQVSKFSADGRPLTIYAAMRRMTDEFGRLGVRDRDILISTNVETRRDGMPRSDRPAPSDPSVAVYFKLKEKDRVLACDRWQRSLRSARGARC